MAKLLTVHDSKFSTGDEVAQLFHFQIFKVSGMRDFKTASKLKPLDFGQTACITKRFKKSVINKACSQIESFQLFRKRSPSDRIA